MKASDFLATELKKRYGPVTRARGAFLYTAKGVRLVDLYQENGRAILGWGESDAFGQLKNVLSRGLTGAFATPFSRRLENAVSALLDSKRKVYFFYSKKSALEASLSVSATDTAFFKPWTLSSAEWAARTCVILEPPLAFTEGLYILAVKDTVENELTLLRVSGHFATVSIPPALEACAARACYTLKKALCARNEKDWFLYDTALLSYWTRSGPYLFLKKDVITEKNYAAFLLHCLDCALVIHPQYGQTSIVPFGVDRGVFAKLVKNPFVPSDK